MADLESIKEKANSAADGISFNDCACETLTKVPDFAIDMAIKHMTDAAQEQGVDLEQTVIACEKFVEGMLAPSGDYYSLNLDFHLTLYKASGNQALQDQISRSGTRLIPYFRARHQLRDSLARSAKEHRDILSAVLDGNRVLSQELMFKHVMLTNDIALDVLNSMRN